MLTDREAADVDVRAEVVGVAVTTKVDSGGDEADERTSGGTKAETLDVSLVGHLHRNASFSCPTDEQINRMIILVNH